MKSVNSKKAYGYLKPQLKKQINEIFELLAQDGKLKQLYSGWCELQSEIILTYKLDINDYSKKHYKHIGAVIN